MSDAEETSRDEHAVRLGAAIRAARGDRHTVHELAEIAGVSVGLLSQIERGIGNPSFKTLHKIARALDIRIGELVEASSPIDRPPARVVRSGDRTRLQFGSEGLVYELLTPDLRGDLEMLQTSIPPGFSNETDPFKHEGEECVLVITGELTVEVAGERDILRAGDAITIDAQRPHWWHNHTDHPAVIVGAVTPPTF